MSATQHTEQRTATHPGAAPAGAATWGKRLGFFAFAFFLIKGLAWLVVPAALAVIATR